MIQGNMLYCTKKEGGSSMAGIVIWLVILVFIFTKAAKGKNQNHRQEKQPVQGKSPEKYPENTRMTQQHADVKRPKPSENSAAQRRYKKEFKQTHSDNRTGKTVRKEAEEAFLQEANQIVAAAKANTREVERDNDRDAEAEHLMDAVYDVMLKGPKDTIDFQRDFIAEGIDMLNSMEL